MFSRPLCGTAARAWVHSHAGTGSVAVAVLDGEVILGNRPVPEVAVRADLDPSVAHGMYRHGMAWLWAATGGLPLSRRTGRWLGASPPDPSSMVPSQVASYITLGQPFGNHNQSSRLTFSYNMLQHVSGLPTGVSELDAPRQPQRYVLETAQSPVVLSGHVPQATGVNASVWFLDLPSNAEDSILVSRAAVDRGLWAQLCTRTYDAAEDAARGRMFGSGGRSAAASVDDDGIVSPGTHVSPGSTLVQYTDGSALRVPDRCDPAVVTSSAVTTSPDGSRCAVIHTVARVALADGDKLAPRASAQKCTVRLVDVCDLPFDGAGNVPDVVMAAAAFPSRCTPGHMMEASASLAALASGHATSTFPAAPFTSPPDSAQRLLSALSDFGTVHAMDGTTGQPLQGRVGRGFVYTSTLPAHRAAPKCYGVGTGSRARLDPVTGQPVAGRRQHGGLRLGEMEKDALVAHGVCREVLGERLGAGGGISDGPCEQRVLSLLRDELLACGIRTEVALEPKSASASHRSSSSDHCTSR